MTTTIDRARPNDILLGRGSGPNQHTGNQRFRALVWVRKREYNCTSRQRIKRKIASEILADVASYGGRFLRPLQPSAVGYLDCKQWKVESRAVALEKTMQALREPKLEHSQELFNPNRDVHQSKDSLLESEARSSHHHQDAAGNSGLSEILGLTVLLDQQRANSWLLLRHLQQEKRNLYDQCALECMYQSLQNEQRYLQLVAIGNQRPNFHANSAQGLVQSAGRMMPPNPNRFIVETSAATGPCLHMEHASVMPTAAARPVHLGLGGTIPTTCLGPAPNDASAIASAEQDLLVTAVQGLLEIHRRGD